MKKIIVDINNLDSITATMNNLQEIFLSRQTQGTYKISLNPDIPCSEEINSVKDFLLEAECRIDDEALVCLTAAQYPPARDQMIELIKNISHYNRFDTKHALLRDCETPFGFFVAFALALHNQEQVIYWTEFIKGLDLNHEVNEVYAMEALFKLHGLTDSMLDLAVVRVLQSGQFGIDQVQEWMAPIKDQVIFAEFIRRLATATCQGFIEDTSPYKIYARNKLICMNIFLESYYSNSVS